ncbi:MAG: T9SS type A sorting domain-containing protein, partial [Candidatus Marinimicrobia bacterium]|nr:T9SS type A sorting domain-containing protein [Candidatus Neomarinimicrobiota bacterium]
GELGMGSWTMYAVDSLTMEIDSVQITLEVVAVGIDRVVNLPKAFELGNIYPNPTNAWINFDLDVEKSGQYSIVLYALDGREITSRSYDLRSGKNLLQWGMGALASGNYIISATNEGRTVSRQVSVIK